MQKMAQAIQRVETVLRRKPEAGRQDDAPAHAEWRGGARFVASHPNGQQVSTDMPAELGGNGEHVTPGWLFRAGLASCAASSILMAAASAGVALDHLEVEAGSRSDTRGLLGMREADGSPVYGGPADVTLAVRIGAADVDPARLRAIVEAGVQRSPVPNLVRNATALALSVDVVGADAIAVTADGSLNRMS
jgi:uncharacterized OsmC-like protein